MMFPTTFIVPTKSLKDHPLYERERGMHLPWYRRGRIPLGLELGLAVVCNGVAAVLFFADVPGARPYIVFFGFVLPLLLSVLSESRISGRFVELRRSGCLGELYLAGRDPLETYAAFLIGNRHALRDMAFAPGMAIAFLSLMDLTNPVVAIIVLFVGGLFLVWTLRRKIKGYLSIVPENEAPRLLALGPGELLFRETPNLAFSIGLCLFLLAGVGSIWVAFFVFYAFRAIQGKKFRRFRNMQRNAFRMALVEISRGEEPCIGPRRHAPGVADAEKGVATDGEPDGEAGGEAGATPGEGA